MLAFSRGLGLNFDVGPVPKFDVGDYPDEPLVASDLSPVVQSQTDYTQTLVKNVAGQLQAEMTQKFGQLKKRAYLIGALVGIVSATGIALGIVAFKRTAT